MKKHVLFIQGAGEGGYEEDALLAQSLREKLGESYEVHYPKMPKEGITDFETLKDRIDEEMTAMDGPVILVGHSAGGTVLAKYLTEVELQRPIEGIFLISPPFTGDGGWQLGEDDFREDFGKRLPEGVPVFLYHSRDDEWVPFEHQRLFAKAIPGATVRQFDGRGHQFNNDLSEMAADIKAIANA